MLSKFVICFLLIACIVRVQVIVVVNANSRVGRYTNMFVMLLNCFGANGKMVPIGLVSILAN